MQITCLSFELGPISADGAMQDAVADFLLNDVGVIIRGVKIANNLVTKSAKLTMPHGSVGFYDPFFEAAFTTLAARAVVLLKQQKHAAEMEGEFLRRVMPVSSWAN